MSISPRFFANRPRRHLYPLWWLFSPMATRRPLFLIHPAGGQVFPYVHLAQHLGLDQPCYGLQAKGLEEGQDPHVRIEDMATYYIEALRTVQPEGPYLLGGWSMGGVVAFEMAQQLHAQGHGVALLALLDSRIPAPDERFADQDFEATLLVDVVRYFDLPLDLEDTIATSKRRSISPCARAGQESRPGAPGGRGLPGSAVCRALQGGLSSYTELRTASLPGPNHPI